MEEKIYDFVIKRLEQASETNGGTQRKLMGDLVEELVDLIWHELEKEYVSVDAKIRVGNKSPVKITNIHGRSIKASVDRHCYINGELVCAVECKTYLDKCFMQRADSDFDIMYDDNADFDRIIVALENAVAEDTYNFFLDRDNIGRVFFLANGKRNSKHHISHNHDRINKFYIECLIDYFRRFFEWVK